MDKATVLLTTMQLDIGGAETHVVDLARYLTELGYRVLVASNGGCFVERLAAYGVPHYQVPLHDNKPGCYGSRSGRCAASSGMSR